MPILCSKGAERNFESWEPRADVYRTPLGWVIKLELAGVDSKDINIELQDRDLCVSGFRRDWIVEQGWQHHSMEIAYSHFHKNIKLPGDIGRMMISSEFRQGMLLIHLTMQGESI